MVLGLAILVAFQLLGAALESVFKLPLPGSVLGMMLLALALFTGVVKLKWVEAPANFLLRNMTIFFVPLMVGMWRYFGYIGDHWLILTCALIGSTFIVMYCTGVTVQFLNRRKGGEPHE